MSIQISDQVHRIRKLRGLSQADLGALLGTTQSRVSQIENPDYNRLSFATVEKVAEVLDCDIEIKLTPRFPKVTTNAVDILRKRRYLSSSYE